MPIACSNAIMVQSLCGVIGRQAKQIQWMQAVLDAHAVSRHAVSHCSCQWHCPASLHYVSHSGSVWFPTNQWLSSELIVGDLMSLEEGEASRQQPTHPTCKY